MRRLSGTRTFGATPGLGVVVVLVAGSLAETRCGQGVETSDTACAIVRPPLSLGFSNEQGSNSPCNQQCAADQSTAAANGLGGDFQDLLTCIGNANGFPAACYGVACTVHTTFIGPPNGCTTDGGP